MSTAILLTTTTAATLSPASKPTLTYFGNLSYTEQCRITDHIMSCLVTLSGDHGANGLWVEESALLKELRNPAEFRLLESLIINQALQNLKFDHKVAYKSFNGQRHWLVVQQY